jgi:hypothetical protein
MGAQFVPLYPMVSARPTFLIRRVRPEVGFASRLMVFLRVLTHYTLRDVILQTLALSSIHRRQLRTRGTRQNIMEGKRTEKRKPN